MTDNPTMNSWQAGLNYGIGDGMKSDNNGWTSVDEQLPPISDTPILVVGKEAMPYSAVSTEKGIRYSPFYANGQYQKITHWMPIPPLPQDIIND